MNPKSVLMPLRGNRLEQSALDVAMLLAKKNNAYLDVWHPSFDPYVPFRPYTTFGISIAGLKSAIAELSGHRQMQKKKAELMFKNSLKKSQLSYSPVEQAVKQGTAGFRTSAGSFYDEIAVKGRATDLIVMSRAVMDNSDDFVSIATSLILGSGRPLLIFPRSKNKNMWPTNDTALIGWNGSIEAAHAVHFALPFLGKSCCWVLTAQKGESRPLPLVGHDLVKYLKGHEIEAKTLDSGKNTAASERVLLDTAKKVGAGLIVMGAYTHNHVRENILGGMTDFMLREADIPILIAH